MEPLNPLFCSAMSLLTTALALGLRKRYRIVALLPIWVVTILTLKSLHQLTWPYMANSILATYVVNYFLFSAKILVLEEHAVHPEVSTRPWSFVDCYRISNNPGNRPVRPSHLDDATPTTRHRPTRLAFALRRASRAMGLWAFDSIVIQPILRPVHMRTVAADFSPEMELLPPWLIFQPFPRQAQIRAITSTEWIWVNYYNLDFYHCLFAIIFVSILRFDQTDDWPPIFGNVLEASSVRGFWGRFWHKHTTRTYGFYGLFVSRKLMGLRLGSRAEKTFLALFIFTLSGLCHGIIDLSLGIIAPSRDLVFFEMTFVVIALEIAISGILRRLFSPLPSALRKVAGMVWVYVWFFSVVPIWLYPKLHHLYLGF
ncbi:membrane bound O-acyl transferase family-domain-containing protein [Dactylonectria estremocensis]|uniref:Membrane bound O-acyl transferase family-domain-containing protein n=1 Tax=Dactylonectria estremocensis TaxID=1079267 RepID=A0A9P9IY58_9HYPO|nr:membrane bound O-acyl transferase family-domain-containing protein [Dactylonectria estremocensis]